MQAGAFDAALGAAGHGGGRAAGRAASAPGWTCCAAQIAFASGRGSDAPAAAAQGGQAARAARPRPGPRDLPDALDGGAVRRAPGRRRRPAGGLPRRPGPPAAGGPAAPVDLLLDGLALLVTDGPRRRGADAAAGACSAFAGADIAAEEGLRWGWLAQAAASALWDDEAWRAMLARQVQLARDAGALDAAAARRWPRWALRTRVDAATSPAAASLIAEADSGRRGDREPRSRPYAALMLAALRGDEAEAVRADRGHHRRRPRPRGRASR